MNYFPPGESVMKKSIYLLLLTTLLISACSGNATRTAKSATELPPTQPPASTRTPTLTPSLTEEPTEEATEELTEEPTIAPTATAALPTAALAEDAFCRLGPGENYYNLITKRKGETIGLNGRNENNTWILTNDNIYDNQSPSCWVPVSAIKNPGALDGLSVAKYELLPPGPSSITAPSGVCGNNKPMIVEWSPAVDGVEYRLYRNWVAVSTQTGSKYYDVNLPDKGGATSLTYMVQGINEYGTSPSVAVSVTVCGKK